METKCPVKPEYHRVYWLRLISKRGSAAFEAKRAAETWVWHNGSRCAFPGDAAAPSLPAEKRGLTLKYFRGGT